jgi:hypothetical protein
MDGVDEGSTAVLGWDQLGRLRVWREKSAFSVLSFLGGSSSRQSNAELIWNSGPLEGSNAQTRQGRERTEGDAKQEWREK